MINGALAVSGPTLAVLGYFAVVGAALRVLLGRWVRLPRGLGVTVGLGLALAVVAVSVGYVVSGEATAVIVPLLGLSAILVLAAVVQAVGRRHEAGERLRPGLATLIPVPSDAVALGAAFVALGPVLRYGLTSWTAFAADFPDYAASAQVWLSNSSGGATFLQTHPDPFGSWQLHRAVTEKPMATALLVIVDRIAGVRPYSALTPVMLLSLFVLVSALFTLARTALRGPARIAVPAVLVSTFSVVPMSRVFDAQLGHVVAVALASVVLVLLAGSGPPVERVGKWVFAGVAAVTIAACVGSNPTLILGTSLTLGALAVWLALPWCASFRAVAAQWARVAALTALLSVPFASWYAVSLALQTTGEPGYEIPLAGPLSLIGLQTSLADAPGPREVLLQWALLLGAGGCGYLVYKRSHRGVPASGLLVVLTLANGVAIAATHGLDNYATHKWLAVAVSLVVPMVLVRLVCLAAPNARRWIGIPLAGLAVCGAAISWMAGTSLRYVASDDLLALSHDARLAVAGTVNISLGSIYENSTAPLVIAGKEYVVANSTYAEGAPPSGDWLLTRQTDQGAWPHDQVIELNDTYALLHLDLEVHPGTVLFGSDVPEARGYLFGSWSATEDPGTVSAGSSAWIVFDLGEDLRAGGVVVTLDCRRSATADSPSAVTITVNGKELEATQNGDLTEGGQLQLTIPADVAMADGGRVNIHFARPDPLPSSDFGEFDARELGLRLSALTVGSAGG